MSSPSKKTVSKPRRTVRKYIEDRLQYKINNYTKLAHRYRRRYWYMATISVIGAILVPALVSHQACELVTTLVSLTVAITVALDKLFLPREHWRNYSLVSALLREEEMYFSTRSGPYSQSKVKKDENVFDMFVQRVEDAIHTEREETIVMRTKPGGQ